MGLLRSKIKTPANKQFCKIADEVLRFNVFCIFEVNISFQS